MRKQVLKAKFGVSVKCHFGKPALLLPLLLLLLLLLLPLFLVSIRVIKLWKGLVCILRLRFLLWLSLFFQLGGGSVLILQTSSSFLVWFLSSPSEFFLVSLVVYCFSLFFLFWGLWFLYDLVVLECVFLLNFLNCDLGLLLFLVSNSWFVDFWG